MERGQLPSQVVRSILFRRGQGSFFLVLLAGPGQASWRSLRKHLGVSRISMASSKEVLEVTGCEIGTVSPLGITHSPPILADEGVFEHAEISLGSGKRGVAIIMNPHHLKQALHNLELGQFSIEARPADKVSEK